MTPIASMSRAFFSFMFTLTLLLFFKATTVLAQSGSLPEEEKNALHEIADQLGKKDWDFNLNPCDGNSNWSTPKRYDMPCDLNRNFLSGTIPKEWESTNLEYMSLIVNRLSKPIPKYLGNITTLVYLNLESNSFNGTIPTELEKLVNLENLILSDNNLTGELPIELNNLKKLTEL
ncbi:unnamed protein product [Fraxinus pennsylvanica]|uniref:Uncharacterized protein n=1 Tax=Fraxinus pennsylvanica TaxID=56036 RepID=A0AAD1ZVE7_9LAMI|nr:unnamed protein product [Fraxinus pennsylvanica]